MDLDLNLLSLFRAVAETRNFREAADRLGVTRSAVSQGVRRLEEAAGVALVLRTTRSVRLTEAGERLHAALRGPLDGIAAALEQVDGATPRGHLRLAASSIAERVLSGPRLASFLEAHPGITVEVTVTDAALDLVAEGYDAAIRLGELVEQDMVAVPVSGPQRDLAAASPLYLERAGVPEHPRDLARHRCIGWRPSPGAAPWRHEFEEHGRPFRVALEAQVTTNDLRLMLRLAVAGAGLVIAPEEVLRPHVERGELVTLLGAFQPPFPGLCLVFPHRRSVTPKLRALIEHLRWAGADA